jgi:hypothetical protein
MQKKYCLPFLFSALSVQLIGCTQQSIDSFDTLIASVDTNEGDQLTKQQATDSPFASAYVSINDNPKILMALAFVETNPESGQTQMKWISSDRGMIVTENGRIVKTLSLPKTNIASISSNILTKPITSTHSITGYYDWPEEKHYGYIADVSAQDKGEETFSNVLMSTVTHHWQEQVSFPQLQHTINNEYWVSEKGSVFKTIQYLGPQMTKIEMSVLTPYDNKEGL